MRQTFPGIVEKGRVRDGRYASQPGERNGAFIIQHPKSGQRYQVIVSDGSDWQALGLPGIPWEHVSVRPIGKERTPNWSEMCWAKGLFWDDGECVVEFHPPKSKYVNTHEFVLHLWRMVDGTFPMPPLECV